MKEKKTMLEIAREIGTRKANFIPTAQHRKVAVEWAKGNLSFRAVSVAFRTRGTETYAKLCFSLRDLVNKKLK